MCSPGGLRDAQFALQPAEHTIHVVVGVRLVRHGRFLHFSAIGSGAPAVPPELKHGVFDGELDGLRLLLRSPPELLPNQPVSAGVGARAIVSQAQVSHHVTNVHLHRYVPSIVRMSLELLHFRPCRRIPHAHIRVIHAYLLIFQPTVGIQCLHDELGRENVA